MNHHVHHAHHHISHENHHHASSSDEPSMKTKKRALFAAVLAAFVAMLGVWNAMLDREILLAQSKANNEWAYHDRVSVETSVMASNLALGKAAELLEPHEIAAIEEGIAENIADQKEIREEAEALVADADKKRQRVHFAEIAILLAEVAVILVSVSLLVSFAWPVWLSIGLSAVAIGLAGWGLLLS